MEILSRLEAFPDEDSEARQEARSLKGDVLLAQGRWAEAAAAYDAAYRTDLASDDRLWGLIGRARAYLRLGRKEEARRDYENGKALYDDRKDALDPSRSGRFWGPALEALGKDLFP